MMEITKHPDAAAMSPLVAALAKPGADIVATMTPRKAVLAHGGFCIVLELMELDAAVENNDVENWIEECGDLLFYLVMIADELGVTLSPVPPELGDQIENSDQMLRECIAALSTAIQKIIIYDAPIDAPVHAMPITAFWGLCLVIERAGHSTAEIVDYVHHKLRARFPEGAFSNEAARQRADKAGVEYVG